MWVFSQVAFPLSRLSLFNTRNAKAAFNPIIGGWLADQSNLIFKNKRGYYKTGEGLYDGVSIMIIITVLPTVWEICRLTEVLSIGRQRWVPYRVEDQPRVWYVWNISLCLVVLWQHRKFIWQLKLIKLPSRPWAHCCSPRCPPSCAKQAPPSSRHRPRRLFCGNRKREECRALRIKAPDCPKSSVGIQIITPHLLSISVCQCVLGTLHKVTR